MIGISKLYCGRVEPSDPLRYGRRSKDLPSHLLQFSADKKPVVVWNVTRRCNLNCVHCYSKSSDRTYSGELSREEGLSLLDDLADYGVPVVLFSGGEPLMHENLFDLAGEAARRGIRAVVSSNGTLIDEQEAEHFAQIGLSYVGISLDGMRQTNDAFRKKAGAFDKALAGIRNCQRAGVKVGLRFTINRQNVDDIDDIFKLLVDQNIPRVCFYHLVYTGRADRLIEQDLDHQQTRVIVDKIIDHTADLHRQGLEKEVLTVDNHTDGPYLYLRMVREQNPHAEQVMDLLKMNGGNSSGIGIGCVSWDGSVYADQFWRHYEIGNVRQKPFSKIWADPDDPLLVKLRDRKPLLQGRCAQCRYLDVCNGNLRVRAEAVTGNLWACDPACYLTDAEIGL